MATTDGTEATVMRAVTSQQRYVLPPGAREIIFVRHGSAGGEIVNTLQFGELTIHDPPLLPEGRAQAQAVAHRLHREPISRIFVTSLQRTAETAAPLVALTGIEPIVVPELREAHMGDWEKDFHARAATEPHVLRRMLAEENWEVIPNAEKMDDFAVRVRAGVEKVASNLEVGAIGVSFVHGGTIGEICHQATQSRRFAFFAPENTSLTRLVIRGDGTWSLRSYNDVAHL